MKKFGEASFFVPTPPITNRLEGVVVMVSLWEKHPLKTKGG